MRTISVCGKHKNDHYCEECKRLVKLIQEHNPCNDCKAHTNDEVCAWSSSCPDRRKYESWRIKNGYDPAYDPDVARNLHEAGLL